MLTKWNGNRPNRFTDYLTAPSRFDLSHLMLGMYNMAWSFQQVADAVGNKYANADRHLRGEMVTTALIAHRRNRMLGGMEHWDTAKRVAHHLATMPTPRQGWHHRYVYDGDTGRANLVWQGRHSMVA